MIMVFKANAYYNVYTHLSLFWTVSLLLCCFNNKESKYAVQSQENNVVFGKQNYSTPISDYTNYT